MADTRQKRALDDGDDAARKRTALAMMGAGIAAATAAIGSAALLAAVLAAPERPLVPRPRFVWQAANAENFRRDFRFARDDFSDVLEALRLPPVWITAHGDRCTGAEALLMLVFRLHRPVTMLQIAEKFGVSESAPSATTNEVAHWLERTFAPLLEWDAVRLSQEKLLEFADAVFALVGDVCPAMNNIAGFIDGTLVECARPKGWLEQQALYSGHKRRHGIKFQAVSAPDGTIVHLGGPLAGKRHDMTLFAECRTAELLRARAPGFVLYGDKGYANSECLRAPYKGAEEELMPEHVQHNTALGRLRVTVEWAFGTVKNAWRSLSMASELKPHQMAVARLYRCAVLLTNVYTCLYGNAAADKFGVEPPSLHEYLHT
jgi:hypothetical protein